MRRPVPNRPQVFLLKVLSVCHSVCGPAGQAGGWACLGHALALLRRPCGALVALLLCTCRTMSPVQEPCRFTNTQETNKRKDSARKERQKTKRRTRDNKQNKKNKKNKGTSLSPRYNAFPCFPHPSFLQESENQSNKIYHQTDDPESWCYLA